MRLLVSIFCALLLALAVSGDADALQYTCTKISGGYITASTTPAATAPAEVGGVSSQTLTNTTTTELCTGPNSTNPCIGGVKICAGAGCVATAWTRDTSAPIWYRTVSGTIAAPGSESDPRATVEYLAGCR